MKVVITLLACGLAMAGSSAQESLKTFTSPDGLFRFRYSHVLVNCMPQQDTTGPTRSGKPDGHQPVSSNPNPCADFGYCDGPGSDGSAMTCLVYPDEKFKNVVDFVAATFYVSAIQSARTEGECLKGSPHWLVIGSKGIVTINQVQFQAFEIADNWTNHSESGPAYRAFHNGKCYELGIQTVMSRADYDPRTERRSTKKDWSEVEGRLRQALNSFEFLK
jgi:hypothetical protein